MNYVALSGGADSTAVALLLHERGEEFELVFSDTGAELPETYWMVPRVAQHVGAQLHVVSNGTFFQHLLVYGWSLPCHVSRWCTRLLKQVPQDRFFAAAPPDSWVAIGIRADEPRRANLRERDYAFRYPLIEAGLAKQDVLGLCRQHDLLSPVYEWRSNTSCFCCPFQRKRDWLGLLQNHPSLYAMAEEWEEQSLVSGKAKGIAEPMGWSYRRLRELREADESQLRLWSEPEGEACTICSW